MNRGSWLWGSLVGLVVLLLLVGGVHSIFAQPQDEPVILSLDLDTATVGDVWTYFSTRLK